MGKNDIQVVPVPHKELQAWWNGMTETNQKFVKKRIGFLIDLIHIEHQVSLVQALAQFWEESTTTFVLGVHELTPTLEEYRAAIGVEFDDRLVQPPVGVDPLPMVAEYLELNTERMKTVLQENRGKLSLKFLVARYSDLPKETGSLSARAFILAFFGFVLFPSTRTAMDPILAWIAKQACLRWDYSNMILAETVMSLNYYDRCRKEARYQRQGSRPKAVFKGPTGMLYMWFIAHIKRFLLHTCVVEIDETTHPLGKFNRKYKMLPKLNYGEWQEFIMNLTPDQIRWRIAWPKFPEARLTSSEGDMVPLLGFNGATAYCPLRVIRQYGMIQEVPPAWSPEPVEFQLKHYAMDDEKRADCQAWVDMIVRILKKSPKQAVVWPEKIEGEIKLYSASEEYIAGIKARLAVEAQLDPPRHFQVNGEADGEKVEPHVPEPINPRNNGEGYSEDGLEDFEEINVSTVAKKPKFG